MSDTADVVAFAGWARLISLEARRIEGVTVPFYRSPPEDPAADRSLRRTADGVAVAIRIKGRPAIDVILDMVDGLAAANNLQPGDRRIGAIRTEVLKVTGLAGQVRT